MLINLLSGPRNVSTALMYSFAQRPDTRVIDEPLYGYYLKKSEADHPGREEVLSVMEKDGIKAMMDILSYSGSGHIFIKNMAHHFIDLPTSLLHPFVNIFLIRNPEDMLPSLANQIPEPVLRDTALKHQWNLFVKLEELGQKPLVIDSENLLSNPKSCLNQVCKRVGISFDENMLTWKKGPKSYDGIWAKHWYQKLHETTGFVSYNKIQGAFPKKLVPLLEECRPYYVNLRHFAIPVH